MVIIKSVQKDSPAYKAGISASDKLLTINGNEIADVLDYRFYQTGIFLKLEVEHKNGDKELIEIKKREYDELGLEFDTYLMDKQHSCKNDCVFCFIDQLPKGMRKSLYFKDDDSRLSFLFGNYVTLTNLTQHEIDRIIKMHISPINVSVHTTNPELRCKMMNNRFAGDALKILKQFADAGIKINCQIVSCPGLNDGDELRRSIEDLAELYPSLECIAVVPVGLTKYRDGLYPLKAYTKETALETLNIINEYGNSFFESFGTRLVYAADEFFIKADLPIPETDYYEDFDQLENGVGLISLMNEEFMSALEQCDYILKKDRYITCAGGVSAAPYMRILYDACEAKFNKLHIQLIPIINNFFGEQINVSGLITGGDLIEQLKGKDLGEELLIPSVMLKRDENVFLDDITLKQAEEALNIKITPVDNDGAYLLSALLGEKIQ